MEFATWIIGTLLFVVVVIEANDTITVIEHGSFTLKMTNYSMKYEDICSVQTPTRLEAILLYPEAENVDGGIAFVSEITIDSSLACKVRVSHVTSRDTGKWSLMIRNAKEILEEEFDVRVVVMTRDVVPKEKVTIIEGQNMFLRFKQNLLFDLVECRVNWTNGRDVVLTPGNEDDPLVRYWGSRLRDECGVQAVNIAIEDGGGWTLRAMNRSGHIIQGDFTVQVVNETNYFNDELIIIDKSYETIELGSKDSKYCQSTRPNGKTDDMLSKPCSVVLTSASKGDGGNWTAKFAVPGQVDEIETVTSVRVIDLETLETSLAESARYQGGLDLLCRWSTNEYVRITASFCRFVRPDGVAFSLEDGVGSVDYSYYGEGVNFSDNVKYCGITIHSPADRDVGIWQCVIGVSLGQLTKGGFIEVPSNKTEIKSDKIIVTGGEHDVFVENGTSFTIGCRASVSLTYCWFTHPNRSLVTPAMSKYIRSGSRDASYTGQGLGLGECTMKISEAVMSDQGTWSCNMGVMGSADLQVPIAVYVTDGSIVAKDTEFYLKYGGTATINCHTSPVGIPLRYCRFVRPDGVGLGFTSNSEVIMERYHYEGSGLEKGECGVKIEDAIAEDIGQWACAALPVTSKQEGQAQINVQEKSGLGGGGIAGIAIASIVVVALVIGVAYSYLQKRG